MLSLVWGFLASRVTPCSCIIFHGGMYLFRNASDLYVVEGAIFSPALTRHQGILENVRLNLYFDWTSRFVRYNIHNSGKTKRWKLKLCLLIYEISTKQPTHISHGYIKRFVSLSRDRTNMIMFWPSTLIINSDYFLPSSFFLAPSRRLGLRRRANRSSLPPKEDKNYIPRILGLSLLPRYD